VNCTSIPWDLFEAELFGYVKGAFTGATTNKEGKAKLAEGGTLFLDEIGDLPYKLQAKLLTFAEKKFFYPIGSNTEIKVDVKLIFATNRNLKNFVREEKFREDLYYRINQIEIHIPPLRDRKEDIEPLINHFISLVNRDLGLSITGISKQAFEKALNYSWPGNVRELKNVIYKAAIDTKVGLIKDLPITQGWEHQKEPLLSKFLEEYISSKKEEEMEQAFEDLKIAFVKKLLERYGGNKSKVARLLNISRNTLNSMLKED
jgi:transcriptional regulator with PAS, ATPase and Fis domain